MTASPTASFATIEDVVVRILAGLITWFLIEITYWLNGRARQASSGSKRRDRLETIRLAEAARSLHFGQLRLRIGSQRLALVLVLAVCSALIWFNTSGNQIGPPFILLWIVTSLLWAMVFAPAGWNLWDWLSGRIDAWRRSNGGSSAG